jgi:hypothetical protein
LLEVVKQLRKLCFKIYLCFLFSFYGSWLNIYRRKNFREKDVGFTSSTLFLVNLAVFLIIKQI